MATAGDYIGATVGDGASRVAIGKHINFGDGDEDVPERSKFDEMFRLVYEIRERVSVMRTWLVSLTVAVGLLGIFVIAKLLGG